MRVLVVWEPILTTDWRPPGAAALGRISDGRARQFWDPGHLVAAALNETAKQKPPQPQPACCIQKGFYWDEAIGTHRTGAGETHPRPFFGAARFFESFQVRRRPSPKSPDGSRRGNAELDTSNMVGRKRACCSSPAAMCYWFATCLIAWGVLSVVSTYWHPLHWYSASITLFATAIGCVATWNRNRSFYCAITGPLFLIAGIFFLFADLRIARVNGPLVWSLLLIGTAVAFLLEWRYAKGSSSTEGV